LVLIEVDTQSGVWSGFTQGPTKNTQYATIYKVCRM